MASLEFLFFAFSLSGIPLCLPLVCSISYAHLYLLSLRTMDEQSEDLSSCPGHNCVHRAFLGPISVSSFVKAIRDQMVYRLSHFGTSIYMSMNVLSMKTLLSFYPVVSIPLQKDCPGFTLIFNGGMKGLNP